MLKTIRLRARFSWEKNMMAFASKTGPVQLLFQPNQAYAPLSTFSMPKQHDCKWVTSDNGLYQLFAPLTVQDFAQHSGKHVHCQSICHHRTFATECSRACETWPRASSVQSSGSGRLVTCSAASLQHKHNSHPKWVGNDHQRSKTLW